MNANIIRPMFCQECFDKLHPDMPDRFVSMQKGSLLVQKILAHVPVAQRGFTPHLITEFDELDGKVFIKAFCTMENCGIKITAKRVRDEYTIHLCYAKIRVLLMNDWKALLQYKDADFSLLSFTT